MSSGPLLRSPSPSSAALVSSKRRKTSYRSTDAMFSQDGEVLVASRDEGEEGGDEGEKDEGGKREEHRR